MPHCAIRTVAMFLTATALDHMPARADDSTGVQGIASYYGAKFDSLPTASGERFDMHRMTAAHRTLPFGTRVKVTNLGNGRAAIVRINDRGPFIKGRLLDLSYAAARQLRLVGPGTGLVRLDVLPAVARARTRRALMASAPVARERIDPGVAGVDPRIQGSPHHPIRKTRPEELDRHVLGLARDL